MTVMYIYCMISASYLLLTIGLSRVWLGPSYNFAAEAVILSESSIDTCIRNATAASTNTTETCRERLYLTFLVESGVAGTETYTLSSALDEKGLTSVDLGQNVTISFRKYPTRAIYPISYSQNVNGAPTEKYSIVPQRNCESAVTAQCGSSSNGFCCTCPTLAQLGLLDTTIRDTLQCSFGTFQALVVCFEQPSNRWLRLNRINAPNVITELEVSLMWSNSTQSDILRLGSSATTANSSGVVVTYKGDLTTATSPPSLESYYLVTNSTFSALVPRENVDLSGQTCNLLGVSKAAFVNQPNGCGSAPLSCLMGNAQIDYMAQRAKNLNALGLQSSFNLSDFGSSPEVTSSTLSYLFQGSRPSLVTVVADLADVVVRATIIQLTITRVIQTTVGTSFSLDVYADNRSSFPGSGRAQVKCQENSVAFPSVPISAEADAKDVHVQLTSTGYLENIPKFFCTVELLSGVSAEVTSTYNIAWDAPVVVTVVDPVGNSTTPSGTIEDYAGRCAPCSWFSLCFYTNKCIWQSFVHALLTLCTIIVISFQTFSIIGHHCCGKNKPGPRNAPYN